MSLYYRLRRPLASILIFALLSTLVPLPTVAEQVTTVPAIDPLDVAAAVPSSGGVRPIQRGRVSPLPASRFVLPRVTPLAFKPFDVVDPSTGKKVSRSTTIYLPHEKRHVNAGKYYDDVNKLEKSLNTMGYTLRSHGPIMQCRSTYSHGHVVGHELKGLVVSNPCKTAAQQGRLMGSQQTELLTTVRYQAVNRGHPMLQPNVINQLSRLDAMVSPSLVTAQQNQFQSVMVSGPRVLQGLPTPTPRRTIGITPVTCKRCKPAIVPTPKPHKCLSNSWFPNNWYSSYWHWASLARDGIKDKSVRLPRLCDMPRVTKLHGGLASVAKPWSTSFGSTSTAEFSLGTNLQIGGDFNGKGLQTVASAKAQAYLLGQGPFSVASATARAKGRNGSIDLTVLGQTIWNPHGTGKFHGKNSFNETFFSFQIPINILWFQITLEASAQGSFGMQYGMNLGKMGAGFFVGPFIGISATFSANFGIGIIIVSVSVGVYGNIMIAQFGLTFSAHGKFWTPAEYSGKRHDRANIIGCKLYFQYQLGLDDNFTALSGQVGIQAQACVDLLFWSDCATAQLPLFNWSGIHASDNLFSIPSTPSWTQVGPWYTDRPQYGYQLEKGMAFSRDDKSGEPAVCHALGAK